MATDIDTLATALMTHFTNDDLADLDEFFASITDWPGPCEDTNPAHELHEAVHRAAIRTGAIEMPSTSQMP